MSNIDLNIKCPLVHLGNTMIHLMVCSFMQGNARRVHESGCAGNGYFWKLSKFGLAPLLWCIIIALIFVYTHSIILGISLF